MSCTMAKTRTSIFVLVVALFTSGCAPLVVHYFEPEVAGVPNTKIDCDGLTGFREYFSYSLGGQRLNISVDRHLPAKITTAGPGLSVFVRVEFQLRSGQTVTFEDQNFRTTDVLGKVLPYRQMPQAQVLVWGDIWPPPTTTIPLNNSGQFHYSAPSGNPFTQTSVILYFEIPIQDLTEFIFYTPQVALNGNVYNPPPIHFREKSGFTVFRSKC